MISYKTNSLRARSAALNTAVSGAYALTSRKPTLM
jgi:hypothetical protein